MRESATLHFELSHLARDQPYTLHVGRARNPQPDPVSTRRGWEIALVDALCPTLPTSEARLHHLLT
jgi:hypothetical protein